MSEQSFIQISGLNRAVSGNDTNAKLYQAKLDEHAKAVFGNSQTITKQQLFSKDKSIFNAYKNMSDEGKKIFDKIIGLDGNVSSISDKEYKTLYAVLDADLSKSGQRFILDDKIVLNETNGIYNVKDSEINNVYNSAKSRQKVKAENQAKEITNMKILSTIKEEVSKYNLKNGSDFAKALNLINNKIENNSDNVSLRNKALDFIFNNKYEKVVYRDGSEEYKLPDGIAIFYNNKLLDPENGYVKITHTDGRVEKYSPDGQKVE